MTYLQKSDPEIFNAIQGELSRQREGLEMIASENYTSLAVMEAQGSVLTNKYAEGYPSRRYYGGCRFVDICEQLAIERAKKLFQAGYANVQPHSGSQANMAVFFAALKPGDKILGLDLCHGGHLTHGAKVNFSGSLYESCFYTLHPKTEALDYDRIDFEAQKQKPRLIIAGFSAYPKMVDFKAFRDIADRSKSALLVDMAHIAGLVAGGAHPSPIPYADYVTATTHKTLKGPRGGLILTQSPDFGKILNSKVFPGLQGGPLEHVIAGKAAAFKEALRPEFKKYIAQTVANAKALASALSKEGFRLISGGTDTHIVLVDVSSRGFSGRSAEALLESASITVNKNTIPKERRSPFEASGIRLGSAALTARGMGEKEMLRISQWIGALLSENSSEKSKAQEVKEEVKALCRRFPLYPSLPRHA